MRQRLSLCFGMSYVFVFTCGLTAGMFAISGCGGGDDGDGADDTSATDGGETGATNGTGDTKVATTTAYVDKDGRIWLGKDQRMPLNLWYADPHAVASEVGTVPAPATDGGATPDNGNNTTADPMPAPAAVAAGGVDWKSVAPGSVIDGEVTAISNRFKAKLQTLANYNSSYLELPPHIATLTLMAAIAAKHPDDIRWKENSRQIRDLAAGMMTEELQRGAKSYKQVNDPYLAISDILAGSPPGGLPAPREAEEFVEYVEIGSLMKRFEVGVKNLQINGGTVDLLKENADDLKREAGVMAAIGTAITTEGYGYSEDDEFKGFAAEFVNGCKQITEGVDTGNLDKFQLGFSAITQGCQKCHNVYN